MSEKFSCNVEKDDIIYAASTLLEMHLQSIIVVKFSKNSFAALKIPVKHRKDKSVLIKLIYWRIKFWLSDISSICQIRHVTETCLDHILDSLNSHS